MRATSKASLTTATERFEPVLAAAGEQAGQVGEEIFAVVDALDSSASLRRALTDPTRSADAKAELAERLLGGSVRPDVVALVAGMARERWSADTDLPDALEDLGTTAQLVAAEHGPGLMTVEDELFRFGRVLADQRELRVALAARRLPAENRVGLAERVLEGASPETIALVRRTVSALRQRSVTGRLARIGELAAERRKRVVASVLSAAPLTQAQLDRLTGILSRAYGTEVHVNAGVNPSFLGGLRIQVGAEVVDATILSKLEEARRRIAG